MDVAQTLLFAEPRIVSALLFEISAASSDMSIGRSLGGNVSGGRNPYPPDESGRSRLRVCATCIQQQYAKVTGTSRPADMSVRANFRSDARRSIALQRWQAACFADAWYEIPCFIYLNYFADRA
jgi:hypothetical protein